MVKKYRGKERQVFLDGYAQGWADCRDSKALDPNLTIHKGGVRPVGPAPVRLRYTDAPGVGYNPGGEQTGVDGHARIGDPCKDCATLREMGCDGKDCVHYIPGVRPYKTTTGTELQMADMERKTRAEVRRDLIMAERAYVGLTTRYPTADELAILGPRKPCDSESMCPVAPGCHICGLTREELAILDKAKRGGKNAR